jgi:SNF2 family DNA or RNA helicase
MTHQKEAIYRAQFEKNLFMAWEPGTGKTCATIQILRQKYQDAGALRKTIILAPKVVLNNWKAEFEKFSVIPKNYIHVLTGPIKKRTEFFKSMKAYSSIVVINYDAFQNQELCDAIKEWGPEILVCDESHYIKNYQSKRAKNIAGIADICNHKYMLTGTPILNNSMDLFMQYRVMDGGKTFGHNFFVFRAKYFHDKNAGWKSSAKHFPDWQPREGSQVTLMEAMKDNTQRVEKKDCLDLPPLVVQDIKVEMSPEQKKHYEEMKKYFITYVNGEAAVAQLAITKALRLQQIVSGFVKTDEGEVHRMKKNPRLDALKELLEILTSNHKVIVWACFKENYKMISEICDGLKIEYCELHGEISDKKREQAISAFNSDPGMRVLIAHPGAGGIGINLVSATYSIYYSRGPKLGDYIQSQARNYRRGSEIHDKITRINLVANETIDELIAEALQRKVDLGNSFLDYIKRNGKKYGL